MYMAAAATEMGDLPGTISRSTAFLAMWVAAFCADVGSPRFEQNRDIKSPVVIRSTCVSRALRMSLKQRPISFLLILLTAQISWNSSVCLNYTILQVQTSSARENTSVKSKKKPIHNKVSIQANPNHATCVYNFLCCKPVYYIYIYLSIAIRMVSV